MNFEPVKAAADLVAKANVDTSTMEAIEMADADVQAKIKAAARAQKAAEEASVNLEAATNRLKSMIESSSSVKRKFNDGSDEETIDWTVAKKSRIEEIKKKKEKKKGRLNIEGMASLAISSSIQSVQSKYFTAKKRTDTGKLNHQLFHRRRTNF